jgi:hypothetical protein
MSDRALPDRPQGAKDAKLFVGGRPGLRDADLTLGAGNWDAYALAYKLAGDLLAQRVGDSPWHSNLLGLPIVFLYRHYLELRLKELLESSATLLDLDEGVPTDHYLSDHWHSLRPRLEQVWPDAKHDLDAVEEKIHEFVEVDASAETFRYPVYKDGRPTLRFKPQSLELNPHIDTAHLEDAIAAIEAVLGACSLGLSAYLDAGMERLAQYQAEAAPYEGRA